MKEEMRERLKEKIEHHNYFVSIFLFHAVHVEFKMEGIVCQCQGSHEIKMHDIFKLMVYYHKIV